MKAYKGLVQNFNGAQARREIEEELRFHLDLLTDEHCRHELDLDAARAAARQQFGDVEQIRDQCVEISMRNSPLTRALKSGLILVFLIGTVVKFLSTEFHVTRVGVMLMTLGLLGRLFLYVRGLNSSRFFSKPDASSRLFLGERDQVVAGFDQSGRTPLERLISEK
jgi:hypothetical protein